MINHTKASHYFPDAYEGSIKIGENENSIISLATKLDLNTILKRFGDWVITTEGITCLTKDYFISITQIDEENWVEKLSKEWWVNSGDFELIFYSAKDLLLLGVLQHISNK